MVKDSGNESSRRDEINAFSAMANGGFQESSAERPPENTHDTGTFDFSAAIRADHSSSPLNVVANNDGVTFDFRAAIRADHSPSPPLDNSNKGTFDFAAAIRSDHTDSPHKEETSGDDSFLKQLRQSVTPDVSVKHSADNHSAERRSFAKAGQMVGNSGTFSRLTPGIARSGSAQHRHQNLEAAALALADDDEGQGDPTHKLHGASQVGSTFASAFQQSLASSSISGNSFHSTVNSRNQSFSKSGSASRSFVSRGRAGSFSDTETPSTNNSKQKLTPQFGQYPTNKTPMHVQQVHLPRPLFFGSQLPPRVLKEAKKIVDDALENQKIEYELSREKESKMANSNIEDIPYTPDLGRLPPGVRNLVSALRCYGFGLDITKGGETKDDESSTSPFVAVFCPRWSEDRKRTPASAATTVNDEKDEREKSISASTSNEIGKEEEKEESEAENTASVTLDTATSTNETMLSDRLSDRDMFSAYARRGSDYASDLEGIDNDADNRSEGTSDTEDSTMIRTSAKRLGPSSERRNSLENLESKMIRSSGRALSNENDSELSEQALFTQWVHGGESPASANNNIAGGSGGTFQFKESFADGKAGGSNRKNTFFNKSTATSGTFMNLNTIVSADGGDSDDDSVVGSEMKKKVGVNEHLNAALASLEDEQSPVESGAADPHGLDPDGELTQVPLTEDGGRPLSNQELMNAYAPLFAEDDPPLPSESDLGNHETREEQQRSKEQRRIQAFIEKFCPHNVFGPLACPNPAASPDDNHSWNSTANPLQCINIASSNSLPNGEHSGSAATSPMAHTVSSEDLASLYSANGHGLAAKKIAQFASSPKPIEPGTRYGWWNKPLSNKGSTDAAKKDDDSRIGSEEEVMSTEPPIQLPPVEHSANGYVVQTPLKPSPETLHKQNRALSDLHPATSLAQALPFLSDRPPSYRYLQVDTQAIAFPAVGDGVEPLFCSLAIYHIETIAHNLGDRGMAPIPDLQRCGKVTETLHFDIVNNPAVEKRCASSLSPYTKSATSETSVPLTRCGVFPLPSNLSVYNLYAVITVGKVISDGSDFEPYLRSKSKTKEDEVDMEALRTKAEKASNNHGDFVMPFAFGVAPLLQVFGADVPHTPSSRAVQIPLFRFAAGRGERQIIDHIMVMLYPRADHRASGIGGPALVTNGGTAMLVMRNFGYLGLHEVINGKSSLARDRLVDFTGELQLCRKVEVEQKTTRLKASQNLDPHWTSHYTAKATTDGGRSLPDHQSDNSCSLLYAKELAPVPLLTTPFGRPAGIPLPVPKSRMRGHSSGEDIEPYFHTSFCNELLCLPRVVHNCQKGNIVIKVEMREIQWNAEYGVFLAHTPTFGPCVHNLRRGPFLVPSAYTSCSARCSDPYFLDEFKLKLPLLLGHNDSTPLCLFFTVYRLSFSSRKKWGIRLLGKRRSSKKFEEITGDMVGETDVIKGKDCQLIQLGCGFLPLEKKQSLLENGNHDVKISYLAKYPLPEFCDKEGISPDSLVMSDFTTGKGDSAGDESVTEDGDSQESERYLLDTISATSASDRDTVQSEYIDDNRSRQQKRQAGMLLQVRVSVQSSIHSQNSTLNEFLSQEPRVMMPFQAKDEKIRSFLRLGKDEIFRRFSSSGSDAFLPSEDVQYERQKLLISTVDVAKQDMCSVSELSAHLIRVCKQLWKIVVVGTGNLDLKWADPSAKIPLRVHAFATLLQILGSTTLFLSKRGVTELDGNTKWNFVSLSRVVGLLFDEEEIFGDCHNEVISDEFLSVLIGNKDGKPSKAPKRGRNPGHVRSNFEFGNASDGVSAIINENNPASTDGSSQVEYEVNSSSIWTNTQSGESGHGPLSGTELRNRVKQISGSPKIDSINDFRNAMQTGNRGKEYDDDIHEGRFSGNAAADSWIMAFGGSSGVGNRRWMTAPTPGLSTIKEDITHDETQHVGSGESPKERGPLDALDSEIILSVGKEDGSNINVKRPVKQFRVPKRTVKSNVASDDQSNVFDKPRGSLLTLAEDEIVESTKEVTLISVESPTKNSGRSRPSVQSQTLPTTDADLFRAGTSFLDAIEKSLGIKSFSTNYSLEDEGRALGKHHRKTMSHSSIDWSIPNDDLSKLLREPKQNEKLTAGAENMAKLDESMSTLSEEMKLSVKLPSFAERLSSLGVSKSKVGRWFPYTYEIIIMQWGAILEKQRSSIEQMNTERSMQSSEKEAIEDAASRTTGVIIACAPVLFEVIKQSLGSRVTSLIQSMKAKSRKRIPPLVTLDDKMLASLEQLIAMLTDACLDSRNFDSYETRKSCTDVNDSIVIFLRDMFAFLNPSCVYRLTMMYWSRLVAKDTRQLDARQRGRDTKIGLSYSALTYSHEIMKLQLNAVAAFVRFPDMLKVNSPQMNSWANLGALPLNISSANFFDDVLDHFEMLSQQSILNEAVMGDRIEVPRMRPHWLAEIVVDICFCGIEYSQSLIQQRSASHLLELFWSQSQRSFRDGYSPIAASMYITFIEKVLSRTSYLADVFTSKGPKSQVRRDVVLCLIFVLQSAPSGLLRAYWRKLFMRSAGKGLGAKYGRMFSPDPSSVTNGTNGGPDTYGIDGEASENDGPTIFDMFSLLNVCLSTVEYEGSDEHVETDGNEKEGVLAFWPKEFVMTRERDTTDSARCRRMLSILTPSSDSGDIPNEEEYSTTGSRKWLSHDASMVLIKTAQQIVRELRFVLEPLEGSEALFNPARKKARVNKSHQYKPSFGSHRKYRDQSSSVEGPKFTYADIVMFVRGATSVYLNSLVLRESDIALVKTFDASVEIIKIFGIKIFNDALGETLQHWLRMITFHCGSRRAEVRVPASDFVELILRSTWDCFGSFFRIRIPLLAVQTEVMERIVATAVSRYYRDQRKTGIAIDLFSNSCAEASLTPLWRTMDRLHHQSASQNVAFRSSLVRLAEKIKKLHRAYIAAHALSFKHKVRSPAFGNCEPMLGSRMYSEVETWKRANRISVIRVVNASAGYSKQFLGLQMGGTENASLAHHEAIEDAILDAADVFSPTELPDHRVAWLRKLAQFHAIRSKNAEEATCHYMIYYTLSRSLRLSSSLWSSTPFLPWIDNLSDEIHLEGPPNDADGGSVFDLPSHGYGHQIDKTNSFRRIFYRNENSVRLNHGELEGGAGKPAFYGVSLVSEYSKTIPWLSSKEMEGNMLEEAEAAGDLFQKSGIIASSRYMWGLAAQYYAEKYMYGKLTHVYNRLARTLVAQVPNIDNTLEQAVNVGIPLGRFYRVWFHGGAPDELIGAEFVYRTRTNMSLTRFGKELRDVLRSIIPEKTPIHLVLDGRAEESVESNPGGFIRMGGAPLEPVKVKVTPLRPVVRNESRIRGLPEWFKLHIDGASWGDANSIKPMYEKYPDREDSKNRFGTRNLQSSSRSLSSMHSSLSHRSHGVGVSTSRNPTSPSESSRDGELVGADKFWFIQTKDRSRGSRDWLKGASNDFAEKTIRVTQLQVGQAFPACTSRQTVIHRDVYSQSPLEAAVDNMCLWCAVLFRTLISSNGSAVLGVSNDPGIGIEAAKVVSECIHSSRVKEIGLVLLRKNTHVEEDDDDVLQSYDRLHEDEVQKFQRKLARALVVFMELLHLLIARNRDLLLELIQNRIQRERKTNDHPSTAPQSTHSRDASVSHQPMSRISSRGDMSFSGSRTPSRERSKQSNSYRRRFSVPTEVASSSTDGRTQEESSVYTNGTNDDYDPGASNSVSSSYRDRTDSAIGIQRELQLAFINIAKEIFPKIRGILSDAPKWLEKCCQDNYFSQYTYRQAKIRIGEELTFEDGTAPAMDDNKDTIPSIQRYTKTRRSHKSVPSQAPDSPGGSIGGNSATSRGSDSRSTKSSKSSRSQKEPGMPRQLGLERFTTA